MEVTQEEYRLMQVALSLLQAAQEISLIAALDVDAMKLRAISAKLRERAGDPNAWNEFLMQYSETKGELNA